MTADDYSQYEAHQLKARTRSSASATASVSTSLLSPTPMSERKPFRNHTHACRKSKVARLAAS